MKRFMALILRVGSAFWQQLEQQRKGPLKFRREEDPEDYPTKPWFLGWRQGTDGVLFEDNPYLDEDSARTWEYGWRSAQFEKQRRITHPYLYN
jgi:ribosome modulation factor